MNYVGIDHHRQYSHITWLDETGEVVKSGRVSNLRRELEEFIQGVRDVKAVIEAGRSSYTMVDVLADLGIETTVAHPKDMKAIAGESFLPKGITFIWRRGTKTALPGVESPGSTPSDKTT